MATNDPANYGFKESSGEPEGGYWGKATEKAEAAAWAAKEKKPDAAPRRSLGKRLLRAGLIVAIVLVLIVGVVGIFLPQIASGLAPGIVAGQSGSAVAGKLSVDTISLSWGGPQRVEGFKLAAADGTQIVTGTVETSASLVSLIRGNLDLGDVDLSKVKADIVRDENGVTNVERAVAKPGQPVPAPAKPEAAPAKSGPIKLPEGLRAKVKIREVRATFVDRSGSKTGPAGGPTTAPVIVTLENVEGVANMEPGKPLAIDLSALAIPTLEGKAGEPGSIRIRAAADNWSDAEGVVTPDRAGVNAEAQIQKLPLALIDALLGPKLVSADGKPLLASPDGSPVRLAVALGERMDIAIKAAGSMRDGTASIDVSSPNATLTGAARIAGAIVTAEKPFELFVKGGAMSALVPQLAIAMDPKQAARIDAAPDASVRIETLNIALPVGGAPMNLAGTKLGATLGLSRMSGSVALGTGQAAKPFVIEPLEARLVTDDLSKETRLTASTRATIDGQPAGALDVGAVVQGVVDSSGQPAKGLPPSIQASTSIKGMATAIAQPFVQALNLDLAGDVGPTLDADVQVTSDTTTGQPAQGAQPPINATISIASQHVRVAGGARVTPQSFTTTGDGISIALERAGVIASRFVPATTGWSVAPLQGGGTATITAKGVTVPRLADGSFDVAGTIATVRVMTQNLAATPSTGAGAGKPIQISNLGIDLNLAGAGTPDAQIKGAMAWEGQPFTMSAAARVPGLTTRLLGPVAPGTTRPPLDAPAFLAMKPVITAVLTDVPSALVRALAPAPATPDAQDIGALAESGLGQQIKTLSLELKNGEGDRTALNLSMDASRLVARIAGDFTTADASFPRTAISFEAAPDLVDRILKQYAPDVAAKGWGVARPAWMNIEVLGTKVPLGANFAPRLEAASPVRVRLTTSSPLIMRGLAVDDGNGGMRSLGELGVDGLEIEADVPVGALLGPALPEERAMNTRVKTDLVGDRGQKIGRVNLTAKGQLSEGGPAGPIAATLGLADIDMGTVERFMGRTDGMLSGFIGATAGADVSVDITPAAGAKPDFSKAPMEISAALAAPRLRTDRPIEVSITPDRVRLKDATKVTLDVDPAAANQFLLAAEKNKDVAAVTGPGVGSAKGVASLTLSEPTVVTLDLKRLSLPRAQAGVVKTGAAGAGPRPPADLELETGIAIDQAKMMTADNVPLTLAGLAVSVFSEQGARAKPVEGSPINFRLGVTEGRYGNDPPAQNMSLTGRVTNLVDATGAVDARLALLTIEGDLPVVPTGLVDALLQREGLLLDALGPSMAMKLNCRGVPLAPPEGGVGTGKFANPPVIDFDFRSQRATVTMRGTIDEGRYNSTDPLVVRITEVTPTLSARFIKGIPLVGSFEKKAEDMPATLRADAMVVPLGSTFDGMNMLVNFDPGEGRFATSGVFNELLKAVAIRDQGQVGKRLEAIEITVKDGLASYKTWRVPIGEFTVETEGWINLSTRSVVVPSPYGDIRLEPRHMDVITWVPFGALSDSAMGKLNLGIGGALNKITPGAIDALAKIPFRTRGLLDSPSTAPDAELVAKNLVKQIKPEEAIGNILDGLLKPKPKN